MTKSKLTKILTSNGYDLEQFEIRKGEVEMFAVNDSDGDYDYDLTEERAENVSKLLGWSGFRCGHGGWIFREDYKVDDSDYCDTSSRIHY